MTRMRRWWIWVALLVLVAAGGTWAWRLAQNPLPTIQLVRIHDYGHGTVRISFVVENRTSTTFDPAAGGTIDMIYRVRSASGWEVRDALVDLGSSHSPVANDNLSLEKLKPGERRNLEMAILVFPELAGRGTPFQFGIRVLREPGFVQSKVTEFLSQWLPIEVAGPRWAEVWSEGVTP